MTARDDSTIADIRATLFDGGPHRTETERADAAELMLAGLAIEMSFLKTETARLTSELASARRGIIAPSAASLFLDMETARHSARSGDAAPLSISS